MPGQHVCMTKLVVDNLDQQNIDEDFESYYINEELHRMIALAPYPFNQRVNLISHQTVKNINYYDSSIVAN